MRIRGARKVAEKYGYHVRTIQRYVRDRYLKKVKKINSRTFIFDGDECEEKL